MTQLEASGRVIAKHIAVKRNLMQRHSCQGRQEDNKTKGYRSSLVRGERWVCILRERERADRTICAHKSSARFFMSRLIRPARKNNALLYNLRLPTSGGGRGLYGLGCLEILRLIAELDVSDFEGIVDVRWSARQVLGVAGSLSWVICAGYCCIAVL